jgi:RsbT co-antagonist protein rsbRD N-terminal domain
MRAARSWLHRVIARDRRSQSSVRDRCQRLSSLRVPPLTIRRLPALRQPRNRAAETLVHRHPNATSQFRYSPSVRLADFILANVEPILAEWESFARSVWPHGATADPAELRDEAEDILRATAVDMQSDQTAAQQAEKSKGASGPSDQADGLTRASSAHGTGRAVSGFDLWAVVAEYRALRASVLRLWRDSAPAPDLRDVVDVTRFNAPRKVP